MSCFICPVCRERLTTTQDEKCYKCKNGHSFDISSSSYVNLLRSNQSKSKRHGDDKLMLRSRQQFLDSGLYSELLEGIIKAIGLCVEQDKRLCVLDVGCGEGYYTAGVLSAFGGKRMEMYGIDISKEAAARAARRSRELKLAVASGANLPIADASIDALLNIFAPDSQGEFVRVLKEDGVIIKASPLERHLIELKQQLYEKVYENKPSFLCYDGFDLIYEDKIRNKKTLNSRQLDCLFKMTPYYYKTSAEAQKRLEALTELEVSFEFCIAAYKRRIFEKS